MDVRNHDFKNYDGTNKSAPFREWAESFKLAAMRYGDGRVQETMSKTERLRDTITHEAARPFGLSAKTKGLCTMHYPHAPQRVPRSW